MTPVRAWSAALCATLLLAAGPATASPPTVCAPLTPDQIEWLDGAIANARAMELNLCEFAHDVCSDPRSQPRCPAATQACESARDVHQALAALVEKEYRR